ncbi:MAG TPA: hypothetical protein VHV79_12450 [Mycobacteriales bacterium]|jgi:hypothetical protein|nr:hypothetical protein [Mycobacteriales bacterium]
MLLIADPQRPGLYVATPNRVWTRVRARLFSASLDRQLADGCSPEANRLLAARAAQLVAPSTCRALSRDLEHLIDQARRPPVFTRSPRAPLCRRRILAAEPEVRATLTLLSTPRPTAVRGVAMVRLLVSDGAGPLFNRSCPVDLRALVRQAAAALEPSIAGA